MKYLILIHSNPQSLALWETLTDEQKLELGRGHMRLTEELAESGELIVSECQRVLTEEYPELAEKLRALGCAAECCTSIPEGVAAAQGAAGYDGRVCALGTLYFSGDVRRAFEHSL